MQAEGRMTLGLGRRCTRARVYGRRRRADSCGLFDEGVWTIGCWTRVTPITLHGLQHTHISHLLMEGVHAKVVSERAGHANVNITLSVYGAYVPSIQADVALWVDAWL